MKKFFAYLLAVPLLLLLNACGSVSPVINQYEKAGTLGAGRVELMGNFTGYSLAGGGENSVLNNNLGVRAGVGLGEKMDLKVRYERLKPAYQESGSPEVMHYLSIIPKVALKPRKIALLVPVSFYSSNKKTPTTDPFEGEEYNFQSIAPQVIYTYTNAGNTVDVSGTIKMDILFYEAGSGLFFGFAVGAGFSSDLNKWAIRPEISMLSPGGGGFIGYGIALQVMPFQNKNRSR